jgi:uncharacterized protein (DUF1697 family)
MSATFLGDSGLGYAGQHMAVVISLLRGINLGAHNRVKMDQLRAVYESLGLREVEAYVQSGNLVFRTSARALDPLARRIEEAIARDCGVRTMAVLRTSDEWRAVIARNPFAARDGIEPAKLLVSFLADDPGDAGRRRALTVPTDPEELRIEGRELYVYYPNGMARPKMSMAAVERALATSGTGRNWNTVLKLLEIAERLERAR